MVVARLCRQTTLRKQNRDSILTFLLKVVERDYSVKKSHQLYSHQWKDGIDDDFQAGLKGWLVTGDNIFLRLHLMAMIAIQASVRG